MFNYSNLTFTRFIAALFVIIYHGICLGQNVAFFSSEYAYPFFIKGNTAVLYFFILSGFIFSINYVHKPLKIKQYIADRFTRIYPVYFLGIFIVIILPIFSTLKNSGFTNVSLGVLVDNFKGYIAENKMGLMSNVTMTQTWFYDHRYSINPPNWSLSVEVFFYMVFPILFFSIRQKLQKINFNIVLVLAGLLVVFMDYYSKHFVKFFSTPLGYIQYFILGVVVGLVTVQKTYAEVAKFRNYIFFSVFGLFFIDYAFLDSLINSKSYVFYVGGFVLIIVSLILINKNSILNSPHFKLMGDISYAMYILNIPVVIYLENLSNYSNEQFSMIFFISLLITILLAYLVNRYFETPLKNILRNRLKPYLND